MPDTSDMLPLLGLVELRLDEARRLAAEAKLELISRNAVALRQLLDAEPALFEAQALFQALVILGRSKHGAAD